MSLLAVGMILALASGGCTVMGSTYAKKVGEAEGLARELAALQQKYKDLSAENAALNAQVASLTEDRDRLAADNLNLENVLQAKSDTLTGTILELRQKIAVLETENRRLRLEIADLQKSREETQKASKTYEDLMEKMKGEIAEGQMTISELKGKLTVNMVDAILFDSGKAEVKTGGQAILQKIVSILADVKDKSIRIEGHTDNVPIVGMLAKKYPTNWELSAARALNVARYLQEQGIDPANLSAVAYGEYKPVAANDAPEGRAKNRRIEIILAPKE
ncbi:MAG: chemotaxis protein MotB [Deltaproteobacteria bacterium]|nr:chemotaxis protein MotB [Deltaproteobacteria bacterium]PWB61480.1 MAG: chemotaxis protein MotB [Deltaproteobacteria bacterium]